MVNYLDFESEIIALDKSINELDNQTPKNNERIKILQEQKKIFY